METSFVKSSLRDVVLLKPKQLGSNFRDVILSQLKTRFERSCSRHGYILPGSIAITRVSNGHIEAVSLNGDVRFDVHYTASVCNPPVGTLLKAKVVNVNRFGVMAHSGILHDNGDFLPVVETIVTKQATGAMKESEIDLEKLSAGDEITVEILGKKFELGDDRISVIGRAVTEKTIKEEVKKSSAALGAIAAGVRFVAPGGALATAPVLELESESSGSEEEEDEVEADVEGINSEEEGDESGSAEGSNDGSGEEDAEEEEEEEDDDKEDASDIRAQAGGDAFSSSEELDEDDYIEDDADAFDDDVGDALSDDDL